MLLDARELLLEPLDRHLLLRVAARHMPEEQVGEGHGHAEPWSTILVPGRCSVCRREGVMRIRLGARQI
jgi:hypothetical protein